MGRIEETCLFSINHILITNQRGKDMSEQEVKELDLNGEMLVRREKLAALRAKGKKTDAGS